MRSVDEYLADCLAAISPLEPRETSLGEALGCVLAEAVVSPLTLPRFDNSSMDGFAVRAVDLVDDVSRVLEVVGDVPAGSVPDVSPGPGQAVRIMTGAIVPEGADSVVPVEWTDADPVGPPPARVAVDRPVKLGNAIRRAGEDVSAGEQVLPAGAVLTPARVALLAAVGRARVLVRPRPRVVVLPSGDELVPPGEPLRDGQIHDSNGYGLIAAATTAGAHAEHGGIVRDDPASVRELLQAAAARADLLITTGGVSAGAYDTVKEVLATTGTMHFEKVAMQPGMPQGFGTVDGTPLFTLPGNPVSALISFEVFVRPALAALAGAPYDRPTIVAEAAVGWSSPPAKRQFTRAVVEYGPTGPAVRPVGGPGSHLLADLAEATCLAVVPEGVATVESGDPVTCLLLGGA